MLDIERVIQTGIPDITPVYMEVSEDDGTVKNFCSQRCLRNVRKLLTN